MAHNKSSSNMHFLSKIPTVCPYLVIEFTGEKHIFRCHTLFRVDMITKSYT